MDREATPPVEQAAYSWPIRIYYAETDAGGVVYHAKYLDLFERARTEWVRSLGYELPQLTAERHLLFVVRSINIEYLRPALFNDLLAATVQLGRLGRSKLEIRQTLMRGGTVLATAEITLVCVDTRSFRAVSIPEDIREKMEGKA